MKKLLTLLILVPASLFGMQGENNWASISLPHAYIYPCKDKPCGNRGTGVYSVAFPTEAKKWFEEPDCPQPSGESPAYRMTSKRWISNLLHNVRGLSFKGLVYKNNLGKRGNEFAIFFHEERCYNGGGEYGWVFPENTPWALFYLCANCNLKDQNWCIWPDVLGEGECKAKGDCEAVKKALKNPAKYRYWNVKVLPNGEFLIELVDPVTWDYKSCTIEKPKWFPNLYDAQGYVTINAQKGAEETVSPTPYLHVDDVKVWK